jgi:hypothetical protein
MEKVYVKEVNELYRAKEIAKQESLNEHTLREEYHRLLENFEEAIGQMRLITNVSDKIQKKLDKANAALDQKNQELDFKNKELLQTVEQLTQVRAGKIATTIVLIIASALFLIEEILVEPLITEFVSNNQWVSIGIKLLIVLSLKPIESLLENVIFGYIYKQRKKQQEELSKTKLPIS